MTHPHSGETREAISYGVTSLHRTEVTAQRLLQIVRAHWGIENGLHYRRDVTLLEDHSRVRLQHAPQVMAALNNFVPSLFAWLGYENIPQARRHIEAHVAKGVALLTRALA